MSLEKKTKARVLRRTRRVRSKFDGSLPRVSVFRSLNHIYAQLIDDRAHKTVVSYSSLELTKQNGDKKAAAMAVGREFAKRARAQGIEAAVFDRGPFLYHGRVKALVEGLREGGLQI